MERKREKERESIVHVQVSVLGEQRRLVGQLKFNELQTPDSRRRTLTKRTLSRVTKEFTPPSLRPSWAELTTAFARSFGTWVLAVNHFQFLSILTFLIPGTPPEEDHHTNDRDEISLVESAPPSSPPQSSPPTSRFSSSSLSPRTARPHARHRRQLFDGFRFSDLFRVFNSGYFSPSWLCLRLSLCFGRRNRDSIFAQTRETYP